MVFYVLCNRAAKFFKNFIFFNLPLLLVIIFTNFKIFVMTKVVAFFTLNSTIYNFIMFRNRIFQKWVVNVTLYASRCITHCLCRVCAAQSAIFGDIAAICILTLLRKNKVQSKASPPYYIFIAAFRAQCGHIRVSAYYTLKFCLLVTTEKQYIKRKVNKCKTVSKFWSYSWSDLAIIRISVSIFRSQSAI